MSKVAPQPAAAAVAALVSCSFGCSSAYLPHPGPRLSVVMDGGTVAYVREGKKYEGGLFGGDLEEAVHGNPQAEEYARQFKTGVTTGFATTMLGVAGMAGGLIVTGAQAPSPDSGRSLPVTGPIILGAGIVAYVVGLIVMLNAAPHLYDAVNAYNDGLSSP
jgi:hypothetical protein